MSGGTTISTANGAFGTGNVSLTASNVILTLQGVTNSIDYAAFLNIGTLANTGDLVNLNYNGTEQVGSLFSTAFSRRMVNGVRSVAERRMKAPISPARVS